MGFLIFPGAIHLAELLYGCDDLGFIMGPLFFAVLCWSHYFLHPVLSRSWFSLFFCNCLRKSVWEVTLLNSCMRKKFSHFLIYRFPLSSVDPRIFLFMDFLTCLMVLKIERLDCDDFR